MPKSDQGVNRERYLVIPRTLIFITKAETVLLIKGAPTKRLWANRYNGIGGHVERGEDAGSSALRELREETGLCIERLFPVGTLLVDASDEIGICIFIFRGEYAGGELVGSSEGQLEWVEVDRLEEYPLVEDVKVILPRVLAASTDQSIFNARSFYDGDEKLQVVFGS